MIKLGMALRLGRRIISVEFALIEKVKEILAKFTEYKINENVIESRNGCYITIYDDFNPATVPIDSLE